LVAFGVQRWIVEKIIVHLLPLIAQFGAQMQKIWLLVASNPIASKLIFTNQFLDLSSSNANPINAHTIFDTCQQLMPSPNIFIFKPISIL
jgi:hypothetical protein